MTNSGLPNLSIVYHPADSLRPYANNARTHSKRQIRQIADSIKAFGFINPVLVDRKKTIIAGHGRVEAAQLLGTTNIPTIELSELSEDEVRAYILADNKLAEKAGWDEAILKIELQHLMTLDIGLDITLTGFEIGEIDLVLKDEDTSEPEEQNWEVGPPVSRSGDLWCLGKHRLLCGSALDQASYTGLMNGKSAHIVFADPPYNLKIDGHVCGNGSIKHDEFVMASGEMNEAEFTRFLSDSMAPLVTATKKGSIHFLCMDYRHMKEMLNAGEMNTPTC